MKIAILSDFHLGFSITSETQEDSFEAAKEAMKKAIEKNVDLIIIAGDIFDSRNPKARVWYSVLKIFSLPLKVKNSGIKLIASSKPLDKIVYERTLNHLPVVAIHGNHDRNPKGEVNIVKALENAGLLIHLHTDWIEFEKNGMKIRIYGMSHVPERFAYDMLKEWSPKPESGRINVLVLHQNIDPYVYSPLEKPTLRLSNLPKGFDVIINGHIHEFQVDRINNTLFLVPGSTIITQFKSTEAEKKKGFVILEISDTIKYEFVELKNSRKFYYLEIKNPKNLEEEIERKLNQIPTTSKKPIVKIKIIGEESEYNESAVRRIEKKYKDKFVLLFSKELYSKELEEKIELLNQLKSEDKSIFMKGLSLLEANLKNLGFRGFFDWEKIFHLLADKEIDNALNLILNKQSTLDSLLRKFVG